MIAEGTSKAAPRRSGERAKRLIWALAMAGAILVVAFFLSATLVNTADGRLGIDYRLYTEAARRWLDGGGFYFPYQLTGPYGMEGAGGYAQPILYPPPVLVLLVPFVYLPALLWWAIPLGVVGWAVWRHRPARWSWPALIILFGWATGPWLIVSGNPVMWSMAALAYATHRGWSGPLVLIKLTLAPFALVGLRDRRWWVTLAAVGLVCLAFLPMWPDYVTALSNFTSERGIGYSLPDWPLMLGVVVAWVARTRGSPVPQAGLAA